MLGLLSCIWAQPLPDSRRLGVGNLGSKRGCEVVAPLIRRGEKNSFFGTRKCVCHKQEQHAWRHTHGFISRPFAILGASAGCHLPGALAAQPALPWQGEDGCCRAGDAGMTFPSLSRGTVMAVLFKPGALSV